MPAKEKKREIQIKVPPPHTIENAERVIHQKLATERTDLFSSGTTVVLVLQEEGGTPPPHQ
jgi:hypothetical protein